jgi:hypothetical protein
MNMAKRTLKQAALAAAAAGANGTVIDCSEANGLLVFINITLLAGTAPTLTVTVNGMSPTGVAYPLLVSAVLNATGLTVLRIFPGLTPVANLKADDVLPSSVRIDTVVGGSAGQAVTATIDVHQIIG